MYNLFRIYLRILCLFGFLTELWFSGSDSETNQNQVLECARKKRRIIRYTSNPLEMEEKIFLKHLCLSKDARFLSVEEIQPKFKVCDDNMIIRCINARYPGSPHNSHVFNMSTLKTILEERYHTGERYYTWLLGDFGYALKPYLITPFRDSEETSLETILNKKQAEVRNIVERTMGALKNSD